ncbi:Zinc finger transcription factor ace1 [Cyphellophora attinorum]|uniref:Zinc finger transcription factor ace1 n=1 Tax=Cyphellophora attinorum TaxID=1664694 RepID=A0A0N0NRV9_9EURO|nr:Zinc finger transcription factor ace1 [Phialophora attinorum]KPI45289.1 Zinc finger transcription factor ace1 [Phialophora attinorum]
MATSMPPPPTPLSHRRSNRLVAKPQLPSLDNKPACLLKMSPPKVPPSITLLPLPQQKTQPALLATWLSDKENVAESIASFEQTFSGARGKTTRRHSSKESGRQHRASVCSDEGLGTSIASSDKSLSRKFERALDLLDRDSALGASISDRSSVGVARTAEEVKDTNSSATRQNRRQAPAVTQIQTTTSRQIGPLSTFARRKINKHIIAPILAEERFEDFHPLVTSLGARRNTKIRCLRDVEQSLIFQPLTFHITPQQYRAFGQFAVQVVLDTHHQLPESEQRRASDTPYTNGYFLDLVDQVNRLAAQVGRSRSEAKDGEEEELESPYDEVTLEGGLDSTGNIAELVGWKNGEATSLRTGMPYEPLPGIKRGASSLHDEDVARSMARRKKGYIPEIIHMPCREEGCDKTFTRKCDLAKHEKTHSRPFKCPHENCKYHNLGLPTEKERDRHINDKHDPNPHYYQCEYCEFKTKRESNCKQHMEKKHNFVYERAKGKDKAAVKMTPAESPSGSNFDFNTSSMQSPAFSHTSYMTGVMDDMNSPLSSFDNYGQGMDFNSGLFPRRASYQMSYMNSGNQYLGQDYISPVNSRPNMTPDTPAYSNITGQSPWSATSDAVMDMSTSYVNNFDAFPTPDSMAHNVSRNASVVNPSPMFGAESTNMYDGMAFDGMSGSEPDVTTNDFTLFGGNDSTMNPAFSNPLGADAVLFPPMSPLTPDDFAKLDNMPILDEYDDNELFTTN